MERRTLSWKRPSIAKASRGRSRCVALCVATVVPLVGIATPAKAQLNKTLHDDGWILAAAHAPGFQGSIWRTDLWFRFERSGGTITFTFCESGIDNTDAESFAVDTDLHGMYFEDVVDHFLDIGEDSWLGAIHYTANTEVQVYARVYSISADGSSSYGQLIEGIPTADMSLPFDSPNYPSTQEDQWMFPVKHTADGRFRANVGAVNPTGVEGTFHFQIFDETNNRPPGAQAESVVVPPHSMVQLNDPFADVSNGEWNTYTLRVEVKGEGSGAFGYASVVDNATNDAYFVRGVKHFRPDE